MKKIYFYNKDTKEFAGYDVIEDTAEIPANATTVEPVDSNGVGLYDPTWNETTNSWDSLTKEEWEAKHPTPDPKPTQTQQTLASLTKQVMELQVVNTKQQAINANLTKQLMDLNKGGN
ncbi:hypothetical protein [Ligilactobacillus salivarius]|uniref:hypothetical protein n=1 Tax=Ligilactobacillus salivarius TaxID=1624 RepID=UPI0022E8E305|nr:hypothetical protein [Ligilactobacillus salivarius]